MKLLTVNLPPVSCYIISHHSATDEGKTQCVKQNLRNLLKACVVVRNNCCLLWKLFCVNGRGNWLLRHFFCSELFCNFLQFLQVDGCIASFQFILYIHTVIKHSMVYSVDKASLIKLERKKQIADEIVLLTHSPSFPFTFKFPPSRQHRKLLMLQWSRRWKSAASDIKGDGPPNLPICFIYLA
jgi:hypothetical protein